MDEKMEQAAGQAERKCADTAGASKAEMDGKQLKIKTEVTQ